MTILELMMIEGGGVLQVSECHFRGHDIGVMVDCTA